MNKIFLHNFQYPSQKLMLGNNFDKREIEIIVGFDIDKPEIQEKKQIIQDIINSLLIHDKIAITVRHILKLVFALGVIDTLELIRNDYFELVEDHMVHFPVLIGKEHTEVVTMSDAGIGNAKNSIGWVEKRLLEQNPTKNKEINLFLLDVEPKIVSIEKDSLSQQVFSELNYDLKNGNITSNLGIDSPDRNHVRREDALKIIRLTHINSGLIYSQQNNCDNLLIDGAIREILGYKLSPYLQSKDHNSIEAFEDITNKKGIPDLSELYLNGAISIHDIIKIRENFNGRKFRNWFYDKDYDPKVVINELMSFKEQNLKTKGLRLIACSVMGLVHPIAGIAGAVADSFIIDKMLKGWHPNFFLDNTLKKEIDKKIQEGEKKKRKRSIENRFPKTSRNADCPCGSGKKFKRCHGKV